MLYANIAHDLKTPMTSILGYAKALGDKKVELASLTSLYPNPRIVSIYPAPVFSRSLLIITRIALSSTA